MSKKLAFVLLLAFGCKEDETERPDDAVRRIYYGRFAEADVQIGCLSTGNGYWKCSESVGRRTFTCSHWGEDGCRSQKTNCVEEF